MKERVRGRLAFLGQIPERGTKDIVDEATEAFAAYRGVGRDIIDDLIATLIDARQTIANMAAANCQAGEISQAMIEAGISAYGADDDRCTAEKVLDIWLAMNRAPSR